MLDGIKDALALVVIAAVVVLVYIIAITVMKLTGFFLATGFAFLLWKLR